MRQIVLKDVSKTIKKDLVLKNINLSLDGAFLVIASHNQMDIALLCDHVVKLENGAIVC
jgi:ABC-type sulfate/molybdate transport systems ATPase subunit